MKNSIFTRYTTLQVFKGILSHVGCKLNNIDVANKSIEKVPCILNLISENFGDHRSIVLSCTLLTPLQFQMYKAYHFRRRKIYNARKNSLYIWIILSERIYVLLNRSLLPSTFMGHWRMPLLDRPKAASCSFYTSTNEGKVFVFRYLSPYETTFFHTMKQNTWLPEKANFCQSMDTKCGISLSSSFFRQYMIVSISRVTIRYCTYAEFNLFARWV